MTKTKTPSKAQAAYIRRAAGLDYDRTVKFTQRTFTACEEAGWVERADLLKTVATAAGLRAIGA